MKTSITNSQAKKLLHNKFVVVLGDSVQRAIYKDLVVLLQRDQYLTLSQLKTKGEFSFEQDVLIEGGRMGQMNNGTEYREVRQYRSDHHLLRFYFLTRVFSSYLKGILEDFKQGLKPDVIIVSSCVWDISRYGSRSLEQYKENLHQFFSQIQNVVPLDCLILWNLAMPLGRKIKGGFLVPEVSNLGPSLRNDVIEANFFSCVTAEEYSFDVLDLHFHFRLSLQHRMPDGVHWDALAHRCISSLLLHHIADAWGVDLHEPPSSEGQVLQRSKDIERPRNRRKRPQPKPLDSVPPQSAGPPLYDPSYFWSDTFEVPSFNAVAGLILSSLETNHSRGQLEPSRDHLHSGYHRQGCPPQYLEQQSVQRCAQPYYPSYYSAGGGYGMREDDYCMRRRRQRPRTQPYPAYQPQNMVPHNPLYRW